MSDGVGDDFIRQANRHEQEMASIKARERRERREFWITVLAGVAVVVVILGVVGAIAAWAVANGQRSAAIIESCHASGGTWASLNAQDACLHLEQDGVNR